MARTIALNLLFRTTGTEKLKEAEKGIGTFRKTLGGLGGAIAGFGGGAAIAAFAKDSIKAASDLSESVSKAKVVFGESSKEVLKFAENSATAFGQSRQQAIEAAGTFGNLFVSMKIGVKESAGMSTSLVKLASDLASFNNTDPTEALDALRSGLLGETEPLQRFGINLNEASLKAEAMALGLKIVSGNLNPAQKAQAAYSLILKQSTTAQGDFARTAGGLANQQRIANAQFEDAKAVLGEKLLPIALKLTQFLNTSLVPALSNIAGWVEKNSEALGVIAKIIGIGIAAWLTYSAAVKAAAAAHAVMAVGKRVIDAVSSAWETMRIRMMMAGDAITSAGGPIKALNRQVGGLAGIGSKLKNAVSGMAGALGGPWGLAVAGATIALGLFATRNDESEARVKELTAALVQNKGALDKQAVATVKNALEAQGAYKAAQNLGISLQDVTDAALGNRAAMDRVNAALSTTGQTVQTVGGRGASAATQWKTLTGEALSLKEAVGGSNSEFAEARERFSRLQSASGGVIEAQMGVKEGFYDIAGQANKAEQEIKDVVAALGLFKDKALDSKLASLDFRDAVAELTARFKENGLHLDKRTGKFNVNSKAGRENERQLIGMVKRLGEVAQKEFEATGSVGKASTAFNKHREMLLRAAGAMGISRGDLQKLINKYLDAKGKINAATAGIKDRKVRIEVKAGGELIGYKVQGGTLLKADGGVLPGYTPGRDVHMFQSPTGGTLGLSGGESIMRPEWTKAVGPDFVNMMNHAARSGGVGGVKRALTGAGVPGEGAFFKGGGIVSSHSMTGLNKVASMTKRADALYGMWAKNIGTGLSKKFSDMLGVGGPKVQKALKFAKAQAGKPYVWGGSGPGGYDCSGFMGSLAAIIKGKNPYARYFTTWGFGSSSGPMGFKRDAKSGFTVGVTDAGVGHMAGTLGKTNVESSGSKGVRVGGGARGTNNSLFSRRYGMRMSRGGMIPFSGVFDQGGMLPRGYSTVYNGTGGAESLRPSTSTGGASGGGGDILVDTLNVYGVQDVEDLVRKIQKFAKDRGGITLKVRT